MRRMIYFSIAVAGIFFLYFISLFSQPIEVSIRDIWKYDGDMVKVKGIVKNKIGNIIEISDGYGRGKIYYEKNDEIEYGDEIEVEGKVGGYKEEYVVYANKIKICKKWSQDSVSLPYLLENYEYFVGTNVNVTGYVYSISKSYFYLTDEFMKYKIKVYCNRNVTLQKYDSVYVRALFYYDSTEARFYLKIVNENHGVGKYD